jgi:hypothetical protein
MLFLLTILFQSANPLLFAYRFRTRTGGIDRVLVHLPPTPSMRRPETIAFAWPAPATAARFNFPSPGTAVFLDAIRGEPLTVGSYTHFFVMASVRYRVRGTVTRRWIVKDPHLAVFVLERDQDREGWLLITHVAPPQSFLHTLLARLGR